MPETLETLDFGRPVTVDNPSHYRVASGIECILVVRHLSFGLGNTVKYCWRLGNKDTIASELKKARWYLNDEIGRLEGGGAWIDPPALFQWKEDFGEHIRVLSSQGCHLQAKILGQIYRGVVSGRLVWLQDARTALDGWIASLE